ncbi:hypothetical protein KFE25_009899 [Diacronema lutheri]|uniref:Ubiquitin-like domain-containing protein n=1 Tax=Diacronema lutheri TaxID=2081491 RepID=A0A8J5X9W9_DIALT|nr:hypothetical protein KFE25_009899 [Diacronema lutheri]
MEDDDVPLNEVLGAKPKAPEGVSAFNLGKSGRSGAEMFEEENAAIAGEDLTVVLQFTDKEFSAQMKMGHTVELLKHKAREMLDDMSAKLEMRLAETDQVMIDPLSLNDYPIAGQKVVKVKVSFL